MKNPVLLTITCLLFALLLSGFIFWFYRNNKRKENDIIKVVPILNDESDQPNVYVVPSYLDHAYNREVTLTKPPSLSASSAKVPVSTDEALKDQPFRNKLLSPMRHHSRRLYNDMDEMCKPVLSDDDNNNEIRHAGPTSLNNLPTVYTTAPTSLITSSHVVSNSTKMLTKSAVTHHISDPVVNDISLAVNAPPLFTTTLATDEGEILADNESVSSIDPNIDALNHMENSSNSSFSEYEDPYSSSSDSNSSKRHNRSRTKVTSEVNILTLGKVKSLRENKQIENNQEQEKMDGDGVGDDSSNDDDSFNVFANFASSDGSISNHESDRDDGRY